MNDRRIKRLEHQIRATLADIVMRELQDPKIGLVTITRVDLDREFTQCIARWSVLGDDAARRRTAAALERARGFVQRELGHTLHTRTVPHLQFVFDESIAGALRIDQQLGELRKEREERLGKQPGGEAAAAPEAGPADGDTADADSDDGNDDDAPRN